MRSLRDLLCSLFLVGCSLPQEYTPRAGERFWTLASVEHWTRDYAKVGAETPDFRLTVQAAVATYRLGKDAASPRAFWVNDACLVAEGSWGETDFTPPSHGELTLTGLTGGNHTLEADRTGFGFVAKDEPWQAGTTLAIKASGGTLPAFSFGSTVDAEPTLTTWDLSTLRADTLSLPRTQALTVAWTPRQGEVLLLLLQAGLTPSGDRAIFCHYPAEPGTGTVPLDALQTLLPQAQVKLSHLYFASVVRQQLQTESTDIESLVWNGRAASILIQ